MALEDRITLLESQLLPKEELYRRWKHATKSEIAELYDSDELRVFRHHKGPIDGFLFCYHSSLGYDYRWDELHDENTDYYLREDVERCEKKYPDLIGLVEAVSSGESGQEHAGALGDEEIQIDEIRKALMMSPQDFVDFLNCRTTDNRLITSWEESFREASIYSPYFTRENLQNEHLTVHRLDWESFQQREKEQKKPDAPIGDIPFPSEAVDTSDLESQLAEAQKKIEDVEGVRRWNKQFLAERAELQKSLKEKDVRIAELESKCAKFESQKSVDIEVEMSEAEIKLLDEHSAQFGISRSECMLECVKVAAPMLEDYPGLFHVADSILEDKSKISELETKLAEAQKQNEGLRQRNHTLCEDLTQAQRHLAAARQQTEAPAATEEGKKKKRDNSAAIIAKLKKDLKSWQGALPLSVSATVNILAVEETKKTRLELLPFVCEACVSKCDEPKLPCAMFSKEQFGAWRGALPPAHVDDTDRSANPQNTVETVEREESNGTP